MTSIAPLNGTWGRGFTDVYFIFCTMNPAEPSQTKLKDFDISEL